MYHFEIVKLTNFKYCDDIRNTMLGYVRAERGSSRQGCNPAGESPAVSVARVGHVVMPHPGMGNHPGYAWCKRPSRPVDTAVGATWRSSERRSLKVNE